MGIYVHIPFCRSKCFYCGFYSVASLRLREDFVRAMCREIELRRDYLSSKVVDTLYFGGGTPSYLEAAELSQIMEQLHRFFTIRQQAECTIEVNPEDVTSEKISDWRALGFNRLSMGIQSFDDKILKQINRTHSSAQAVRAIELAEKGGFTNVSADFIIGLPGQTREQLMSDLEMIKHLPISHLSVYILSIDSNSVFDVLTQKGTFVPEDDDELGERYQMVSNYMKNTGFEHYEISNFAKDGRYSIHNTSYWQQKEYLGLGPSAHSYNIESRQWNVSHIKSYIESLDNDILNFDCEILSRQDKFNEYMMTRLRTMWGCEVGYLQREYGDYWQMILPMVEKQVRCGNVAWENDKLTLRESGWAISDAVFSDLFVV